ncbi:MAG: hypothetical protein ACYDDF_09840 [Thermoplasmatota archaeon]
MVKRKRLVMVLIGGVALIAVALFLIPIPQQSFSLQGATIGDAVPCRGIEISAGPVSFHWATSGPSGFRVRSCSTGTVYEANGTAGAGSFISAGGTYEFGSLCGGPPTIPCYPANVSGTHNGPLLPPLGWTPP